MSVARLLLPLAIAAVAAACSHGSPGLPGRPGANSSGSEHPDDALARELADPQMRVVTDNVTILYNSGGVIMGRSESGALFATDVTTDCRVDFNPAAPALYINGLEVEVSGVSIARTDGDVRWYVISTASSEAGRVIFVTRY